MRTDQVCPPVRGRPRVREIVWWENLVQPPCPSSLHIYFPAGRRVRAARGQTFTRSALKTQLRRSATRNPLSLCLHHSPRCAYPGLMLSCGGRRWGVTRVSKKEAESGAGASWGGMAPTATFKVRASIACSPHVDPVCDSACLCCTSAWCIPRGIWHIQAPSQSILLAMVLTSAFRGSWTAWSLLL